MTFDPFCSPYLSPLSRIDSVLSSWQQQSTIFSLRRSTWSWTTEHDSSLSILSWRRFSIHAGRPYVTGPTGKATGRALLSAMRVMRAARLSIPVERYRAQQRPVPPHFHKRCVQRSAAASVIKLFPRGPVRLLLHILLLSPKFRGKKIFFFLRAAWKCAFFPLVLSCRPDEWLVFYNFRREQHFFLWRTDCMPHAAPFLVCE